MTFYQLECNKHLLVSKWQLFVLVLAGSAATCIHLCIHSSEVFKTSVLQHTKIGKYWISGGNPDLDGFPLSGIR